MGKRWFWLQSDDAGTMWRSRLHWLLLQQAKRFRPAMMSSVCVPMEPVEPKRENFCAGGPSGNITSRAVWVRQSESYLGPLPVLHFGWHHAPCPGRGRNCTAVGAISAASLHERAGPDGSAAAPAVLLLLLGLHSASSRTAFLVYLGMISQRLHQSWHAVCLACQRTGAGTHSECKSAQAAVALQGRA